MTGAKSVGNVELGIAAGALKLKAETGGEGAPPTSPGAPPKGKEKADGEIGDTAAALKLKAGSGTVSLGDAAVEGHAAPPRLTCGREPDRAPTRPFFFFCAALLICAPGVAADALELKVGAESEFVALAVNVNEFEASAAPAVPLKGKEKAGGDLGDASILRSAASEMRRPLRSTDSRSPRLNPLSAIVPESVSPASSPNP